MNRVVVVSSDESHESKKTDREDVVVEDVRPNKKKKLKKTAKDVERPSPAANEHQRVTPPIEDPLPTTHQTTQVKRPAEDTLHPIRKQRARKDPTSTKDAVYAKIVWFTFIKDDYEVARKSMLEKIQNLAAMVELYRRSENPTKFTIDTYQKICKQYMREVDAYIIRGKNEAKNIENYVVDVKKFGKDENENSISGEDAIIAIEILTKIASGIKDIIDETLYERRLK